MPQNNSFQRPSRRESKQAQISQFAENDQRQQQLDSQSQAQMLAQLTALYGLGQDAAMSPERLRGATLQNDAQAFENAWAQPRAMTQDRIGNAQAGALEDRGKIGMDDIMRFYQATGQSVPPELLSATPPEYQGFFAKQTADKEAARQAALAADAAQQGQAPPVPPNPYTTGMDAVARGAGGVGGGLAALLRRLLSSHPAPDYTYGN